MRRADVGAEVQSSYFPALPAMPVLRGGMAEQTYALSAEAAEFYESTFVPALFAELGRPPRRRGRRWRPASRCSTWPAAPAWWPGPPPTGSAAGSVVGLDANEAMLAVARRLRPDLRWQLGDAGELPFGDGSFDVVLSQAALMFFGDRVAALREMGRVAGVTVASRSRCRAGWRAAPAISR